MAHLIFVKYTQVFYAPNRFTTPLYDTFFSQQVTEVRRRYDKCSGIECEKFNITIPEEMNSPIHLYYEINKFHQNNRVYVVSRSNAQLRGDSGHTASCTPLRTEEESGLLYYPCGLLAASKFNGMFSSLRPFPFLYICTCFIMFYPSFCLSQPPSSNSFHVFYCSGCYC